MRVFLIFLVLCASLMAKDEFFGGEKKGKKEVDLMTITGGRFNHVKAAKNMIFLSHMDNKGKETDIKQFGYYD